MNLQILVFSKDRALQLAAVLESLARHCPEAQTIPTRILYLATTSRHARQYRELRRHFPRADFVAETDFTSQLDRLLAQSVHVLFLVDDNIFYRDFRLGECLEALAADPQALGVSLRLGRNAVYCQTMDAPQAVPAMEAAFGRLVRFAWPGADFDFGYPLELSSSLYRTSLIRSLLPGFRFANPNTLEAGLAQLAPRLERLPLLLCFPDSVTFCNPLNRVQDVFANRIAGEDTAVDAETLADLFDRGERLDVAAYETATPDAVHFEMPARTRPVPAREAVREGSSPLVSVIIPAYNGAAFLPAAVESLAVQVFADLEVLIVDDGSTDGTGEVARGLAATHPRLDIRVLVQANGGLAAARNAGIREARGRLLLPLDCDDRLAPGFLDRATAIMADEPDINLVFANIRKFGGETDLWIPPDYDLGTLLERNIFPYASLYRRELWSMAGGYDPSVPWGAEDWNFWITCSAFGLRPRRIVEPLFLYCVHPGGSMSTRMMGHWPEVQACLRTCHPAVYPVSRLLADHQYLAKALHPDTVDRIRDILMRHHDLPLPHFWLGLTHERAGRVAEAIAAHSRSAAMAPYGQWQPQVRLFLLNRTIGRKAAAWRHAQTALDMCPGLDPVFKALDGGGKGMRGSK